jgi:hypothetical protein
MINELPGIWRPTSWQPLGGDPTGDPWPALIHHYRHVVRGSSPNVVSEPRAAQVRDYTFR